MSALPPCASLGHLPHRRQNAEPELADTQLIVAREYGYVFWPRMKEQPERLAAATGEEADDPA